MARLIWLILILAFVAALLVAASWAAAYTRVGGLLGAPPPRMGTQTTSIRWQGLDQVLEHPPYWHFDFGPTAVPGATRAIIDVDLLGRTIATEPADLAERLKAFHNTGY